MTEWTVVNRVNGQVLGTFDSEDAATDLVHAIQADDPDADVEVKP